VIASTSRGLDTVAPCGAHQEGEIWVRGKCLFLGYYKQGPVELTPPPDAGWYRTGDLGAMDEVGRLMFRGRVKDMLKVGGENVSPADVETFPCHHSQIRTVQAGGRPD